MNKKRGIWAKLMALCLTLLLAVGVFGTTVSAAIQDGDTGEIKVTGVEDNGVAVSVRAYQVMTVNFNTTSQQPDEPVYGWKDKVANWVRTNYSTYIGTAGDNSVKEAFSRASAADIATFYDALAAEIKSNRINLTAQGNITVTGIESATIKNLPMGAYLILIEGGMRVYKPSAVNILPKYEETTGWTMDNPTVEVKSSPMPFDKTVNEDNNDGHNKDESDQGAIGSTVNFDLRANVPQYPDNATAKKYAISDTLSSGLTLAANSIKVYGVNDNNETELNAGTHYTMKTTRPDSNAATSFTLNFTYDQIKTYAKIHVDYNAVINGNAFVGEAGNPNDAHLIYNNNPYDNSSWKNIPDEVKVYTYGLKVNKVDENNQPLTGAEFTLSTDPNGTKLLTFVKTGDSTYRLPTDEDTKTEIAARTTILAVDTDGQLTIRGLALGTYYLTETKAPTGYNMLNTPLTIQIKDEDCDGLPTLNNGTNEFTEGYVALNVENTKGFTLPTTGGMGTVLFTAGGIVIMGAAILLFFVLRRKKAVSDR